MNNDVFRHWITPQLFIKCKSSTEDLVTSSALNFNAIVFLSCRRGAGPAGEEVGLGPVVHK